MILGNSTIGKFFLQDVNSFLQFVDFRLVLLGNYEGSLILLVEMVGLIVEFFDPFSAVFDESCCLLSTSS
jgi:hypothetical protein